MLGLPSWAMPPPLTAAVLPNSVSLVRVSVPPPSSSRPPPLVPAWLSLMVQPVTVSVPPVRSVSRPPPTLADRLPLMVVLLIVPPLLASSRTRRRRWWPRCCRLSVSPRRFSWTPIELEAADDVAGTVAADGGVGDGGRAFGEEAALRGACPVAADGATRHRQGGVGNFEAALAAAGDVADHVDVGEGGGASPRSRGRRCCCRCGCR